MADSNPEPPVARIVKPGPRSLTETEQVIRDLKESIRYSSSLAERRRIDRAVSILESNRAKIDGPTKPAEPESLHIEMPIETGEKLLALLGKIRSADGFNPLFRALNAAGVNRPAIHVDFVGSGVLRVETAKEYRERTGLSL